MMVLCFLGTLAVCSESRPEGETDAGDGDADGDGGSSDADERDAEAGSDGDVAGDAETDTDRAIDADTDSDPDEEPDLPIECGYPTEGYRFREGRVMPPFWLWTCDGEETNLPRLWCGHEATIVHFSVAWCGSCMSTIHQLQTEVMPELEGETVALVEVLLEDEPGEVAGTELCGWWRDYYEPPVETHIPPDGRITGPLLELSMQEAMPVTLVLDDEGVIRIWSPIIVPFDLVEQIRAL